MNSKQLAKNIRLDVLDMIYYGNGSHVTPNFSICDILAVLYADVLHVDCTKPLWADRDRFLLSKGHAGASVYATLAECGFFPKEKLKSYYKNGGTLSGHVLHFDNPGIDFSIGSLGQGIGVAAGKALAAKIDKKDYRVFALIGNGECNEGAVWEAAMFAAQNKLDNFVVIIDDNKMQALGKSEEIINLSKMAQIWRDLGFAVAEVDGHNHSELKNALLMHYSEKPLAVICNTTKGKGVSFMENDPEWHYKKLDKEMYNKAKKQIEEGQNG